MFNLRRYFSLASSVAIVAVIVTLVVLYHRHSMDNLVETAERENVTLSRAFANTIWPRFSSYVMSISRADGDVLRARSETHEIHDALMTLTSGLPVLKVKIYNLDGLTVYSSQPSQIGADKSNNLGYLKSARDGSPASKQSHRDTFNAFSGTVQNRDIVESYVPIWGPDGAIEGIFGLYTDVTPLVARITRTTIRLTIGLLLILGVLYGVLFLIVQRADRILKKQYLGLQRSEEALQESEARLSSFINNIPNSIYLKDTEGRYVLVNDLAMKQYGLLENRLIGRTVYDIHPKGEADATAKQDREVLKQGVPIETERELTLPDGSKHTINAVKFPVRGESGEIVGIGGINIDITERKQAEEALLASEHVLQLRVAELEEAHRKLEMQADSLMLLADDLLIARNKARAADCAKSEFLANMSHELRTPLSAVIGFSEIIKDETFGPVGNLKYREYAGDIHESGQHLLDLINDILDLSKIESGKDELHEDKIEIPKIVRSALKMVGHHAEQGRVKFELELPDRLPALRADERKLKQILVNLLSNAIKFTDAGGEVTLRAWCRMDSGHVFQIIDAGAGIAPEDIPKALSRFDQADGDLNRQYEGTGLGLPLTKALVELHGGVLDMQSQVGVGTTVTVRFPAKRIVASLDNADSLDLEDRAAS